MVKDSTTLIYVFFQESGGISNDGDVVLELYNLRSDPGETINIAETRLAQTFVFWITSYTNIPRLILLFSKTKLQKKIEENVIVCKHKK